MVSNEIAALTQESGQLAALLPGTSSPAMQIMLDDRLFERVKLIAKYMANAEGFTPRHLLGKTEACFAVVTRSLTWKLDPFAVACCTYQTPGGAIGYEGKLCQAILENSGKIEGAVKYEHYGDWSKIQAKFKIQTSDKGKKYAVPNWKEADEAGVGVTVSAKIIGEPEVREWSFDLIQAFPRNSTLWATDPKTQICYTAVRRFANVAAPGLFMGVPFERDDLGHYGPDNAKDITPRPARSDFVDAEGEVVAEGKPLRQHYAEKQEAKDKKDLDVQTTDRMPDTADERGEVEDGRGDQVGDDAEAASRERDGELAALQEDAKRKRETTE